MSCVHLALKTTARWSHLSCSFLMSSPNQTVKKQHKTPSSVKLWQAFTTKTKTHRERGLRSWYYLDNRCIFFKSSPYKCREDKKQRWHRKNRERITELGEVMFPAYRYLKRDWKSTGRSGVVFHSHTSPLCPLMLGYVMVCVTNMLLKPKLCERLGTFDRDQPCHHRLSQIWVKNIQYFHTALIQRRWF